MAEHGDYLGKGTKTSGRSDKRGNKSRQGAESLRNYIS